MMMRYGIVLMAAVGLIGVTCQAGEKFTLSLSDRLSLKDLKKEVASFVSKHRFQAACIPEGVAKLLAQTESKADPKTILDKYSVQDLLNLNYWDDKLQCVKPEYTRRERVCQALEPSLISTRRDFRNGLSRYCQVVVDEMILKCETPKLEKAISELRSYEVKMKQLDHQMSECMKNDLVVKKVDCHRNLVRRELASDYQGIPFIEDCKRVFEKLSPFDERVRRAYEKMDNISEKWMKYYWHCSWVEHYHVSATLDW